MRVTKVAVERPELTVLFLGFLVALGVSAFVSIPRAEDPSFPVPTYMVVAVLPGASPADIEQLVAEPIEDAVRELDDLEDVYTRARGSVAELTVYFRHGVDTDEKYGDLLREMTRLRPELPADVARLDVLRFRTSDTAVFQLALVSEGAPIAGLEAASRRVERRLDALEGVRRAEVWALPERELRVTLDLARLASHGLTADVVAAALVNDNVTIPGGVVDVGARTFGVTTDGRYRTAEDVRKAVVGARDGFVLHLEDVADVEWAEADARHVGRFNGEPAAFVSVTMADDANVFDLRRRVDGALRELEPDLPPGIRLERGFDQSENVAARLDRLGFDFGLAIALVSITLLPLGLRAAGVVMFSIPLSLALGLAALHALGFTLNQLSIVGFVIALGLLVDDSIVVVENIARFIRDGHPVREATLLASRQIGAAVVGCTATLVFAFVPLLALPDASGEYIRSLPVAVIATVLASFVVAVTVVPFLASRWLRPSGHGENAVLHFVERGIEATYARVLDRSLAYPKTTLALAGLLVGVAVALLPVVGISLFPKAGIPQFLVRVTTPEGAGLPETDRAVRFVEAELAKAKDVRFYFANVGAGNPSVYYNVYARAENERFGEVLVELDRFDPRATPKRIDALRAQLDRYPFARIEVHEFENGPPVEAPLVVRLLGDDLDALAAASSEVAAMLDATPGVRDVDDPIARKSTGLELRVDRDRAGLAGVPVAAIGRTVRLALSGIALGEIRDREGESYDLRLRVERGRRPTVGDLEGAHVASLGGRAVPLFDVSTLPYEGSPPLIMRRNGERMVALTADVTRGTNVERVTQQIETALAKRPWPRGVRYELAGERESRAESFGGLGTAMLVTLFGILAILVLEFGSYRSTLVVATVLPLGFVGGMVALFIAGESLSFTATIGFVALMGIEIKNSILLVDATDQLRAEGMALEAAVRRAGEIRFLPIVLTTATALGGLVPLALGGSPLYAPLAIVLVGGLVASTVLARLVTPAAYLLLAPRVTAK